MFLQYVASKDSILELAQLYNVTECTFMKSRRQLQHEILRLFLADTMKWPTAAQLAVIAESFNDGPHILPNICGAIDGCDIPVHKPLQVFQPENYCSALQGIMQVVHCAIC